MACAAITVACAEPPPPAAPAPLPAPAPPSAEPLPQPSLDGLTFSPAPTAAQAKKSPKLSFIAPTLDQELPTTSSVAPAAAAGPARQATGSAAASKAPEAVLAGDFEVKLSVKDWDPKAAGSHIHLILDEGKNGQTTIWPAGTRTQFDAPLSLDTLSRNKPLPAGEHVLAA
jgi:hypothetical protein